MAAISVDAPNFKDKNQHLPGGVFGTAGQLPSGSLWSPTNTAQMDVGPVGTTRNAKLLGGAMLPYLNYGFGGITALVNGGILDLMFTYSSMKSLRVGVTVTAVDSLGNELYHSEGDHEWTQEDVGNFTDNASTLSGFNQLATGWSHRADLRGLMTLNPISITMTLFNYATMEEFSVQGALTGAVVGTIQGIFNGMVTEAVAGLVGVTELTAASMIGLGVFSALLGELTEMGLGLDNSFGPGGNFVGLNAFGVAEYTASIGWGKAAYDMVMEAVTFGKHMSQEELNYAATKESISQTHNAVTLAEIDAMEYSLQMSGDLVGVAETEIGLSTLGTFNMVTRAYDVQAALTASQSSSIDYGYGLNTYSGMLDAGTLSGIGLYAGNVEAIGGKDFADMAAKNAADYWSGATDFFGNPTTEGEGNNTGVGSFEEAAARGAEEDNDEENG